MSDNLPLIQKLADVAPSGEVRAVVREVSLNDLCPALKDAPPLKVTVNPPAILDDMVRAIVQDKITSSETMRRVLAVVTDVSADEWKKIAESLVLIIYLRVRELYLGWWSEFQKN